MELFVGIKRQQVVKVSISEVKTKRKTHTVLSSALTHLNKELALKKQIAEGQRRKMANKHMIGCSILLFIKEIQIKSMRYHFAPTRIAIINKQDRK